MKIFSRARHQIAGSFFLLTISLFSSGTYADEGGVPFWLSGQYASMAAVPMATGWSLVAMPYSYSGSADKSKTFQRGQSLNAGLSARESFVLMQLGYVAEEKILGAQPYIGIGWGPGTNTTTASVSVTNPSVQFNRANTSNGGTDIYPLASLTWNSGNNNYKTYITGDIPVGTYSPTSLSSIGIGHAAMDAGGGYTYLNNTTGFEVSGIVGATYNWQNSQANYKNGIDSHLDWSVSQFVSQSWQVGIAGYVYYQLTADSGSGDNVGAFKSRVAAVGPQIGYLFKMNGNQAYINLRAYKEYWAQNRVEGYAAIATISLPLGK
ncbi:transporter [Polynucleobacter sp. 86C-FISCH]|uniref:SphA family protein n=1 Tax=Polynucleobacter sp. 86C-FISCH TaxID=2689101 RepID=UPI001C0ABE7B|nr:transporter [Polynucleobacter sp. 86C-FISCH]MBU3594838.1 transporter [Polynucleobacter sp. 86C-FISCH]